jgi:hypothetical protein
LYQEVEREVAAQAKKLVARLDRTKADVHTTRKRRILTLIAGEEIKKPKS